VGTGTVPEPTPPPAMHQRMRAGIGLPRAVATALGIAALLVVPFSADAQTTDLLVRAFIFAIFAIGFDLLWGYAGILSLGHSAFFGLGAYAMAIASTQTDGAFGVVMPIVVGGVLVATALAVVVGWIAFYSRATPFYIAVITVALALVLEQVASLTGFEPISQYTRGVNGLPFKIVEWTVEQWYWLSLAALGVVALGAVVLVRSDFGRVLTGIRENESRLAYLGFHVPRLKLALFAFSAAVAAFAGVGFASFTQFASPDLLGLQMAIFVIVLVAVGGRGTLLGPVLGSIVIGLVGPKISERYPEYWQLVLGLLFLVTVVFLPRGLFPSLQSMTASAWKRARRSSRPLARSTKPVSLQRVETADSESENGTLARIVDVRKAYGSLQVLDGVTLEINANEILCIVGPNGAGKSTLINGVTDSRELSHGTITVDGAQADNKDPAQIVALRVGRTFQGTNLMEAYTVADSLFVASCRGRLPSLWRKTTHIPVSAEVAELLQATGLDRVLDARVYDLSHGHRQALELAMALSLEPRILLLDEPTAGLSQEERGAVGRLLRELVTQRRLGIVLIEHDLDFVREITDRVAVLHRGRVEIEGRVEEIVGSALVRDIYLGATT
jgi:branched-chain amino acid transport system permease protein